MTTKIASHFSADMVARAAERAATDDTYKALYRQADHAGKVAGAAVHSADAKAFWRALADDIARHALVTFPAPADAKAIPAPGAIEQAGAELRDLCALVNHAVKAAQTYAKRVAVQEFKAAQMAERAKKARDSIIKTLSRALAVYGVKVNFQAGKAERCEAVAPVAPSDAEKAASAVETGAGADFEAFVAALCQLPPDQLKVVAERTSAAYAAWLAEQATRKAEVDAQAGAEVKAEHNDNAERAEVRKLANG